MLLTGDARPRFFFILHFALLEERGDAREAMTVGHQPTNVLWSPFPCARKKEGVILTWAQHMRTMDWRTRLAINSNLVRTHTQHLKRSLIPSLLRSITIDPLIQVQIDKIDYQ